MSEVTSVTKKVKKQKSHMPVVDENEQGIMNYLRYKVRYLTLRYAFEVPLNADWGLAGHFTRRLRRKVINLTFTAWAQLSQVSDKQHSAAYLTLPYHTGDTYLTEQLLASYLILLYYLKRIIFNWRSDYPFEVPITAHFLRQSSRPLAASARHGLGRSWRHCICNLHDPLPYVPSTLTTSSLRRTALNVRASYLFRPRHPLLPLPLRLPNPVEPSHVSA